jgi:mitogen-activated protein kinase kinase kinase 3
MGSICTTIHTVPPRDSFNLLSPQPSRAQATPCRPVADAGGGVPFSAGSSVGEDGDAPSPETPGSPAVPGTVRMTGGRPQAADRATASESTWTLLRPIGQGSFGEVYLAQDDAGMEAAVKILVCPTDDGAFPRRAELLDRELTILRRLPAHPNVVKYLTARHRASRVFIFMEYCDGGSLRELYLRQGGLSLAEGRRYTGSMLSGLHHLHSNRIAHRDIKCENVFLTKNGDAKLGDFGASIVLEDSLRSSFIGSIHWMAPEVVRREGHTWRADIWSLGCAVMEMFSATHPFPQCPSVKTVVAFLSSSDPVVVDATHPRLFFRTLTPPATKNQQLAGEVSRIPCLAHEFILACLRRTPSARPDASTLLDHPFLRSAGDVTPVNLSFQSNIGKQASEHPFCAADASPLL